MAVYIGLMKQLRLPIFTSKIKVYNLRIVPPSPVFDDVLNFKKQFENEFGKQPLSRSKPHITLAAFRMNSKYQNKLITVFEQLSHGKKFTLDIGGFAAFEKNSNTLHLKVSKTDTIEALHANVQTLFDDHLRRKLKAFAIVPVPHITISKTTGKKMLYKSLAHFQNAGYAKKINVDHLTLVSRSKYKTWDWEHVIGLS